MDVNSDKKLNYEEMRPIMRAIAMMCS